MAPLTENQEIIIRMIANKEDPREKFSVRQLRPSIQSLVEKGLVRENSNYGAVTDNKGREISDPVPYVLTVAGRNYITNVVRQEQNVGTGDLPQATQNPIGS